MIFTGHILVLNAAWQPPNLASYNGTCINPATGSRLI